MVRLNFKLEIHLIFGVFFRVAAGKSRPKGQGHYDKEGKWVKM